MLKISHYQLIQISSYDATDLKNVVKFCVPTWSIFAGPVTNVMILIFNTARPLCVILNETKY